MGVNRCAGKTAEPKMPVIIPKLITAYDAGTPDNEATAQRIAFDTSGHRGSFFEKAFNERYSLSGNQTVCLYRKQRKIDTSLFLDGSVAGIAVGKHE